MVADGWREADRGFLARIGVSEPRFRALYALQPARGHLPLTCIEIVAAAPPGIELTPVWVRLVMGSR